MFYLTLPSNSSMEYYPDNTASNYFTKLPQDINLTGDYEVGLSEIQFSNTYFNISKNDCYFNYVAPEEEEADKDAPEGWRANAWRAYARALAGMQVAHDAVSGLLVVPEGLYESNEYFVYTLNELVRKKVGNQDDGKAKIMFYYNKASKKASLTVYEHGGTLHVSSSLQRILSLSSNTVVGPGHYEGNFIMDLNENFKSVYVYCDLVSARQVGDTMAPLLRIVPMKDKKREVVHHIFEKPHYIPLSRLQFNAIEILLTTDMGKTIAFSSGSTIVTLHFRRKRPDHY